MVTDVTVAAAAVGLGVTVCGGAVSLVVTIVRLRNAVVAREDCDAVQVRRDKACTECKATIVPLATIKEMVMVSAEKTRHDARDAMQVALLKHESIEGHAGTLRRLGDAERVVAVFGERFDVERREFGAINGKLDRLLDAIPALTARVDALEEK